MPANPTRARLTAALALVAMLTLGVALAVARDRPAKVIGKTALTPPATCPTPDVDAPPEDEACTVMGRVTGFQTSADGRSSPFEVREPGRLVAWSVAIGRPNKEERAFFEQKLSTEALGGDPTARLSILKKKGKGEFKLTRQSPVVDLSSHYGEQPIFTLNEPLRVKPGEIVALSSPTWLANFGLKGESSDTWRASRDKGRCGFEAEDSPEENSSDLLKFSKPQQNVGSTRAYACAYRSARLLYWAYYVPGGGGGGGDGGGGGEGGGGN